MACAGCGEKEPQMATGGVACGVSTPTESEIAPQWVRRWTEEGDRMAASYFKVLSVSQSGDSETSTSPRAGCMIYCTQANQVISMDASGAPELLWCIMTLYILV